MTNHMLDAFIDLKGVTKSYISAAKAPTQIDVPVGQSVNVVIANE